MLFKNKKEGDSNKRSNARALVQGQDYYIENGFYVFTEFYLKARGYCCENDCRHCPYKGGASS